MSPNERERGRESAITFASSSRPSASHRWPGACASSHARYLHRHIQSNRRRSHQHLANRTEQELRSRDMNKQNKKRRAEGGGGELSPMVAAVALPGCSCCPAASSWSARAAALVVGSRREEESETGVRLYRGRRPRARFYSQVRWADPTVEIMRPISCALFKGCGPVGLCSSIGSPKVARLTRDTSPA